MKIEPFYTRQALDVIPSNNVSMIPQCGACQLYKNCQSPKMPVSGKGRKGILIVGEFPGETEDETGRHFLGKAGRFLRASLERYDIRPDKDCWFTNSLICHPHNNRISNPKMIDYCRPNIVNTIKELQPKVILLLGEAAVKSVITGWLYKDNKLKFSNWVGWRIPSQRLNAWIIPNFHPSQILYEKKGPQGPLFLRRFDQIIESVAARKHAPWKYVPDYKNHIRLCKDPNDLKRMMKRLLNTKGPLAYDFETNMLKPDSSRSRIVCYSVSDGRDSIAVPFYGDAVKALRMLLKSGTPMIAANLKFEDRWTRKHLKCRVKNWYHDTLLGAHVLDHRVGVSGLKFQAFVRLGQETYDEHIKAKLKAKGSNEENQIKDIPLDELLTYCGMDSLLEHKLTTLQRKELRL